MRRVGIPLTLLLLGCAPPPRSDIPQPVSEMYLRTRPYTPLELKAIHEWYVREEGK